MSKYRVHHCRPCSLTYAVQVLSTSFNRSLTTFCWIAIDQLHQRGIIHKDIKPVNILVDSASGAVWLTGFGTASAKKKKKTVPCDPLQWPFSASLSVRTRCRGKFIWLSKGQAEVISKHYDHGEVS